MDMEIVKKYNTGHKQYNYNRNSIMYKGQMQGKVFVDKQVQFIQCSENCNVWYLMYNNDHMFQLITAVMSNTRHYFVWI